MYLCTYHEWGTRLLLVFFSSCKAQYTATNFFDRTGHSWLRFALFTKLQLENTSSNWA